MSLITNMFAPNLEQTLCCFCNPCLLHLCFGRLQMTINHLQFLLLRRNYFSRPGMRANFMTSSHQKKGSDIKQVLHLDLMSQLSALLSWNASTMLLVQTTLMGDERSDRERSPAFWAISVVPAIPTEVHEIEARPVDHVEQRRPILAEPSSNFCLTEFWTSDIWKPPFTSFILFIWQSVYQYNMFCFLSFLSLFINRDILENFKDIRVLCIKKSYVIFAPSTQFRCCHLYSLDKHTHHQGH